MTDTARLDWLEREGWSVEQGRPGEYVVFLDHQGVTDQLPGPWSFTAPTLREAIEKAMRKGRVEGNKAMTERDLENARRTGYADGLRAASSPSSTAGDSRAGEQPPPAPPIQPHTSDRGEALYRDLVVKEMRQARERVEEAVAAAEAKQRERQPPAAEPQECSGLLILSVLYAIGYVDGVPSTGQPGNMHPATTEELEGALRQQARLAAELSDLHAWTLEVMRRLSS